VQLMEMVKIAFKYKRKEFAYGVKVEVLADVANVWMNHPNP